ncbi:MAG: GDSL-type esterase/lipase family protein [Lachnoclostridium sp.]|nr:GDSL-type esterase/lipase family protein [Lachnospira sp.]MCM1249382.1 GDSL-type esterase/lipase family protein [Lachnoclostridium sp.]
MKKIESRIKKWSFLLVFMVCGVCYLTVMDGWKVYGKELNRIKERYERTYGIGSQKQEPGKTEKEIQLVEENNRELLGEQSGTDATEESGENPGQENASDTEPLETEASLYRTVEDDYFSDAVFIGDSRTVGMFEYGGLEEISTFYASKGLTVYKLFDAPVVSVEGKKKKVTVEEALSNNQFSKIYLMVGINEMGTGTVDTFLAKYKEVVEHLQELQPDAIIYVQGIIKVTTERSGEGDYITNEGIEARNQGLELLADNEKVFYLDVNPLICDETGGMVDSYTFDGVHLKAQYISIWKDFLKCHAV